MEEYRNPPPPPAGWEQKTIENLLMETLRENRRRRRWKIIFRLIYLLIFILIIYALIPEKGIKEVSGKSHVALINIEGQIDSSYSASADRIIKALDKAYDSKSVVGIVLKINSPGGAPVQASQIYNEMMRLRQENSKIKIYAVCTDLCASAAYYIAAGADYIYADPASLVGSIGVLLNGFGFVDTLNKLGVERRLITSGGQKGFLDPFSPTKPDEVAYAQKMLDTVHQQFIDSVKKGRGARLQLTDPDLFSGKVWTGADAKAIGLIDGFGSVGYVARDLIKNKNVVDYTNKPNVFDIFGKNINSYFNLPIDHLLGIKGILG